MLCCSYAGSQCPSLTFKLPRPVPRPIAHVAIAANPLVAAKTVAAAARPVSASAKAAAATAALRRTKMKRLAALAEAAAKKKKQLVRPAKSLAAASPSNPLEGSRV